MWLIVFSLRTILEGTPECLKTLQEHRGLNRRPLLLSKNQIFLGNSLESKKNQRKMKVPVGTSSSRSERNSQASVEPLATLFSYLSW